MSKETNKQEFNFDENLKKLDKAITNLVNKSKFISSRKQVIEVTLVLLYQMVASNIVQFGMRENPYCQKAVMVDLPKDIEEYAEEIYVIAKLIYDLYQNSEPFDDVLFHIFGSSLKYQLGQHMTPPKLAYALAKFVKSDKEIGTEPMLISDIACGVGGLLLSKLKTIYEDEGRDGIKRIEIVANDKDKLMCLATIIQIELHSLIHKIPYKSMCVYCSDAITQYSPDESKTDYRFYCVIPELGQYLKVDA